MIGGEKILFVFFLRELDFHFLFMENKQTDVELTSISIVQQNKDVCVSVSVNVLGCESLQVEC